MLVAEAADDDLGLVAVAREIGYPLPVYASYTNNCNCGKTGENIYIVNHRLIWATNNSRHAECNFGMIVPQFRIQLYTWYSSRCFIIFQDKDTGIY